MSEAKEDNRNKISNKSFYNNIPVTINVNKGYKQQTKPLF